MLFGSSSKFDLARALFTLGGVQFGTFDLGPTAGRSPVYINPRVLISYPVALRQIARLIHQEIETDQTRLKPRLAGFTAVCGVPMGGLHLATAYAIESNTPMVYVRPGSPDREIEGRVEPGQTILMIDDLMTGGTSIRNTARTLEQAGAKVHDAIVLIDREQGGVSHLHESGYRVMPILGLRAMLTYYFESGLIDKEQYRATITYLDSTGDHSNDEG